MKRKKGTEDNNLQKPSLGSMGGDNSEGILERMAVKLAHKGL
jgi:hypothetical protein